MKKIRNLFDSNLVTNQRLFQEIYMHHIQDYRWSKFLEAPEELDLQLIRIDYKSIADTFNMPTRLLIGRLKAYEEKTKMGIFYFSTYDGDPNIEKPQYDSECLDHIDFPKLAIALADMNSEYKKSMLTILISGLALIVSFIALLES